MADEQVLRSLAAQIVSAHIAHNTVPAELIARLIGDVYGALANAGQSATVPPSAEPAVPVKSSVRHDRIICLDCGKSFSMLRRHIKTDHGVTPEEYRQRWGLPRSYPIVAPDYAKARSALAKKIGLGKKAAGGPMRKAGRKAR